MARANRLRIAREIRRARLAAGLRQVDVAEAMGVHKNTVIRWEGGQRSLTSDQLAQLEHVLGVVVALLSPSEVAAVATFSSETPCGG